MKSGTAHGHSPVPREMAVELNPAGPGGSFPGHLFEGLPGMAYRGPADREHTLELFSDGCLPLLGRPPGSGPFPLAPLMHPDDREAVLDTLAAAAAGANPFSVEYRLRQSQGSWQTVWDQGQVCRQGCQVYLQGYLLDVTQRVRLEHERRDAGLQGVQTQKFSALNKLAAGIAHEFNNVVAGILGSAELVAMDLPDGHPGHESLKHVFEASNRARDFVQKIRALAQRPAIERQPILLQPVIEDCLQILRNIIPVRAEIRARINPACPRVNADPAGIHQVVLDLCLHAWQNLPEGRGQIQIELDPSAAGGPGNEISARFANAGHVCLTVRDNSPGLDKNQREKIFDPFNTRKSTGKKIGLELFLVREIIQAHQGEIFVTSEPGQGLAFQIYLPVARPA